MSDVLEAEPWSCCSPRVSAVGGSNVVCVGSEPHGKGFCFYLCGGSVLDGLEGRETFHFISKVHLNTTEACA